MSVVAIPEPVTIDIAGRSDRGKVGEENQAVVCHARTKFGDLLIVANGMGDAAAGSQASRNAADTISSRIEGMPSFYPGEIALEEAVRQANTELTAMAAVPDCPFSNVGVTLVAALLRTDGDQTRVTIGRVGNSRAYLVRSRKLTLLTRGHSVTPDLLDGKWTTPQRAEADPDGSMPSRYLGEGLNLHVEMREMSLQPGDTLALGSDGLWSRVSEQEIERVLADGARSVEEASSALMNLALDAGGDDNVAIGIARLTQSSSAPAAAARSVESESERQPKITATRATPAIEWPAPETITYGTPLNDTQLNATASVPGTFQYDPGLGAVLATGEHTLSVVFAPQNQSDYTLAQATVPLSVAKATPSISWLKPDPINHTTPLGAAQFNACASVPGTFAYTPATGETLEAGVHTLSVTFTPTDCENYTQAQASVSLTVIESTPARITWLNPPSISYGAVLGDEQLNATASVPGSFLYVPAPGIVLPPGEHKLSVIFTPEDQVKYSTARAAVTLIVEARPIVVPLLNPVLPTRLGSDALAEADASDTAERDELSGLARRDREADYAASESPLPPRSPYADEAPESEPETIEAPQEEIPLFRAFHSNVDDERGQTRVGRWSMIFSFVLAIPILCVLIFLVVKARSGAPFIASEVQRPAAAAAPQPQSNAQDPSHHLKITITQQPAGNQVQPGSKSQSANNGQAVKPAQAQTETTNDQPAAQPKIPLGSTDQSAAKAPSPAGTGATHAGALRGSNSAASGDTESADRGETSSPVFVSADTAGARLMESRTPIYPPNAKASGISGTVELDAIISKDGTVKDLRVVSGPAQLRQAAVQSVRTWRYRPFTFNNEPREVETTVDVVFFSR